MKSHKIYLFLIFILLSYPCLKSYSAVPQDSLGRHLWYIELVGVDPSISFNYEFVFAKDVLFSDRMSIRTGIGGTFFFSWFNVGSPLMINYIYGKKHCFEIGTGVLFDYARKQKEYDIDLQALKFIGNIGYRFVADKGFIFKLALTPYYSANRGLIPFFGLSLGSYF